ncbi:MAG: M20/M25/M40 family metallo-hydrolase [Pirellulaceae bacterium]|nr:M20/M25/M40 family metallo-hydrolase [Pirellulaceae bacterium]
MIKPLLRTIGYTTVIVLGLLNCQTGLRGQESPEAVQERLRADVTFLADDEREGRGVGTHGLEAAAQMIATRFSELGLTTDLFAGSPFQSFSIPNGSQVALQSTPDLPPKNRLVFQSVQPLELTLSTDWTPLSLGANGSFSGPVAFAGYGISSVEHQYDDYAGLDVDGKVVVIIRKQPRLMNSDSSFRSTRSTTRHAYFSTKLANAAARGAAAIIFVNDRETLQDQEAERLFLIDEAGKALSTTRIPVMHVLRDAIDPLIQQCTGRPLAEWEQKIDADSKPASQLLAGVTVSGAVLIEPRQSQVHNVVGLLPGSGTLANEYVVLGAHYDHVGMGGPGSLAPGTIAVHNGADDNASGTAVLLEAARQLSVNTSVDRRNIVLIAFAAEERGLLGSKHYVRHPRFPLEQTKAMVNLDMVGRMHDGALIVYGTGTASEFPGWVEDLRRPLDIQVSLQSAGYGPSDHQSFHEVGMPVLHLFTGMHNQYHRPSDDSHLIDYPGMVRVTQFTVSVMQHLATHPVPPTLRVNRSQAKIATNPGWQRAVLGITMDSRAQNCLVASVSLDSPAMQAGLRPGDVIVRIDDHVIDSSRDLTRVMSRFRAGEVVRVELAREENLLTVSIQLGS